MGIDTARGGDDQFLPDRLRIGSAVIFVSTPNEAGLLPLGLGTSRSFATASSVVVRQESVEHGFDGRSLVVVEQDGGLEGQAQRIVVGESGITAKDQSVTTDRQGDGQFTHDAERRFGEPCS